MLVGGENTSGRLRRRCSSMVEHQLPKLNTRVRFPSSALTEYRWSHCLSGRGRRYGSGTGHHTFSRVCPLRAHTEAKAPIPCPHRTVLSGPSAACPRSVGKRATRRRTAPATPPRTRSTPNAPQTTGSPTPARRCCADRGSTPPRPRRRSAPTPTTGCPRAHSPRAPAICTGTNSTAGPTPRFPSPAAEPCTSTPSKWVTSPCPRPAGGTGPYPPPPRPRRRPGRAGPDTGRQHRYTG